MPKPSAHGVYTKGAITLRPWDRGTCTTDAGAVSKIASRQSSWPGLSDSSAGSTMGITARDTTLE